MSRALETCRITFRSQTECNCSSRKREGEKRQKKKKNNQSEEVTGEDFPNFVRSRKVQSKKHPINSSRINTKRSNLQ